MTALQLESLAKLDDEISEFLDNEECTPEVASVLKNIDEKLEDILFYKCNKYVKGTHVPLNSL